MPRPIRVSIDGSSYRLAPFDQENPPPARVVAAMHSKLLPTSPAVRLGSDFLESLYYTILVEVGAVTGAVAWVDETPAGFIVVTDDSGHFMRNALRRRFFRVIQAGTIALLKKPTRIVAVFEILGLMTSYRRQPLEVVEGEILSMGIEDEFRNPEFVSRIGNNMAIDLLDAELSRLQRLGRRRVRAVVDTDNLPAQLFYRGLGWSMERTGVPGWRSPTVEFVLSL